MNAEKLKEVLKFSIKNRLPVLIKGAPGIGKTDLVFQACGPKITDTGIEMETDLIVSHPVVSDPTDYKGLPYAGTDGTAQFLPFGELNALIQAKRPTVFFLDDLGQAPNSVQAAVMQLILARRINGHKVSDFVTFMAATNRREDKAAVGGLLEPVKSRFASIVELEVDTEAWVKWALTIGQMPTELIAFIRFRPHILGKFVATKDITNTPSPRTVAAVGRMQNAGIPAGLEAELFQGAAGSAFAAEYMGFLKLYREIPDIDAIILNPKSAKVSDEPGINYALAGALGAKMTPHNMESITTYLKRIPAEIGVVCVKDAITRDESLTKSKAFVKWASENGNLIS